MGGGPRTCLFRSSVIREIWIFLRPMMAAAAAAAASTQELVGAGVRQSSVSRGGGRGGVRSEGGRRENKAARA